MLEEIVPVKASDLPDVPEYQLLVAAAALEHEVESLLPIYPKSLLEVFGAVFTSGVWRTLCKNTNAHYRYHSQENSGRLWQDLTIPELKIWIGLFIWSGLPQRVPRVTSDNLGTRSRSVPIYRGCCMPNCKCGELLGGSYKIAKDGCVGAMSLGSGFDSYISLVAIPPLITLRLP